VAAQPLLLCVMGPTASGKTDLAVELARARGCELVSVDSALVYRGLDIGSAKPDYPHHLVNIRDPAQVYSAAEFAGDATRVVGEILARGRTPLLVGGTMLYFRAFLQGLAGMPPADRAVREEIARQAAVRGWPWIHAQLAAIDPASAARIHPNHSQRLSRALEVYRVSGVPLSRWHQQAPVSAQLSRYRVVQLALSPAERVHLHRRIELRFELMMAAGFLDEVWRLRQRGDLHPELPALRAVGYRQLWRHLDGECTLAEAVAAGVAATRQLAKRQLTWLRKWPDLNWIHTDSAGNVSAAGRSHESGHSPPRKPLEAALNYLEQAT
jgi:tRNA dimethylallyltransferase